MKEKKVRQKGFLALLLVAIIVLGMPGMTVLATNYLIPSLNPGVMLNSTDGVYDSGSFYIHYEGGATVSGYDNPIQINGDGWVVRSVSGSSDLYLYRPSSGGGAEDGGAEDYYRSLRDLIAMINLPGGDTHGYGVGTALPYSVMKALEDNPEDTLVFECVYKNNKYTFTILGADVKGKITPEISWYGPYWLAQNFFETTVIEPIEPLVIPD